MSNIYSADTPFNSYEEIVEAIKDERVILHFERIGAYDVAYRSNKIYLYTNLIAPLLVLFYEFCVCQAFSISRWFYLFAIAGFLLYTFVGQRKLFFSFVIIATIILPTTVFPNARWLLTIGAWLLGMIVGCRIEFNLLSRRAKRVLMTNADEFERVWKSVFIALISNDRDRTFYWYGCGREDNTSHM